MVASECGRVVSLFSFSFFFYPWSPPVVASLLGTNHCSSSAATLEEPPVYTRSQKRSGQKVRRLYRTNGLLSRIKYRNRGIWCGSRVVPVVREGILKKMPQNSTLDTNSNLNLDPAPTHINFVSTKSGVFFWGGGNDRPH